jgi:hypothetical protein
MDERLAALGVKCGSTVFSDGDMKIPEHREKIFGTAGIPADRILLLHQTHTDCALEMFSERDFARFSEKPRQNADGWILGRQNTGAAVYSADCAPVFIWDRNADLVALLHSGWRGTVNNFPRKTALRILKLGGKPPFSAFIAAHIEPCCFEIGPEVAPSFFKECLTETNGKIYADITKQITLQLTRTGIAERDIRSSGECTKCSGEKFHSFRRTGQTHAQMSYIYFP